ncbi:MAG: phosphatase PAP2 family protein [Lachnospiraceae bacterium]|nr:phosphatase PAP2 family protein [Lachnospiraceae bacterium]
MKNKGCYALGGISAVISLLIIAMVRMVDVSAIGPNGTSIGLSHINQKVHETIGVNQIWYDITEILGGVAILVAGIFALVGFVQLVKGKSLAKVDKEIYAVGGLYAVVVVLYALFEKVIINYRPVIMDGETAPEASFPSSHTMLTCVVMGSAMILIGKYIQSEGLRKILQIAAAVILIVTVVGRLISGVHWFSDIMGGIFISLTLVSIFDGIVKSFEE